MLSTQSVFIVKIFLLLSLTLTTTNTLATSKVEQRQTLIIHTDNPRDHNSFESNTGNSISTTTSLLVLKQLPYDLQFEYMATNSSLEFIDKWKNSCIANRLKTPEREAKYLYSKPVNLYLNKRLYQRSGLAPLEQSVLTPQGEVYLPNLFKHHRTRTLLLTTNISHGKILDSQIAQLRLHNKLIRNSDAHDDGILKMFNRERGDYILRFPQHLKEGPGVAQGVTSYPIAGLDNYQLGHFLCADTPQMRTIVAQMDRVLTQLYQDKTLYRAHIEELGSEDLSDFNRYYQQAFKAN